MSQPAKVTLPKPDKPTSSYLSWIQQQTPAAFRDQNRFLPDPAGLYSKPPCLVDGCERVSSSARSLCRLHLQEFEHSGLDHDRIDAYLPKASRLRPVAEKSQGGNAARGILDLTPCRSAGVRSELAFVVSRKATGDYGAPFVVHTFNAFVKALETVAVTSLRTLCDQRTENALVQDAGSYSETFQQYCREFPMLIAEAAGEGLGRRPLGIRRGGSSRWSRSHEITLLWLRDMVRRWVEYRLNTESAAPQHIGQQEAHIVEFAAWAVNEGVERPEDITRALLIRWLGVVNSQRNNAGHQFEAGYRRSKISALSMMLQFSRVELDSGVPSNAVYLRGELPKRGPSRPRFLEPRVIATLREPSSLDMIEDEGHRTAILIMMQVGLRSGHTCSLPFDCLVDLNRDDSTDKWALSFIDTKSETPVTVPIEPHVALAIRDQQARTLLETSRSGSTKPTRLFINPRAKTTGQLAPEAINETLKRWVIDLDLRDAAGELVNVTPHRFRHTFATELLDKGVPIDVVQKLLGHLSIHSTEIYATVTDTRLREQWEKGVFVNVRGEVLGTPTGIAGDAEWLLHKIGRAVQPLPNGWCGLPIQQTCPHANACLDNCPNFLTSIEFLQIHEAQSAEFKRTISKAEAAGHLRIVEINKRPNENLERIINTLRGEVTAP